MMVKSASRPVVAGILFVLAGSWATQSFAQPVLRPQFPSQYIEVPHTMATPNPPQYTRWGSVQELEGGWAQDTMALRHSAPLVNPDHCSVTNAGYATDPADAGHSLFHTLLLSAFLNRKEVSVLVSGYAFSKPRIIAVKVH